MTDNQKIQIRQLRESGYSYNKISEVTGVSQNTIKTFCRRNGLGGNLAAKETNLSGEHKCLTCGVPVPQTIGRKVKKFCSDSCRMKWWKNHPQYINRKAIYKFECACCHKPFEAYGNANRKYCSHECYIEDRFGGGGHD